MSVSAKELGGEALGTALLLYLIVGSGIAVERLSSDGAVQLAVHAIAVGAGLGAVIAFLMPVSGAHFNPSVSIGLVLGDELDRSAVLPYIAAQFVGAVAGVVIANATFGEPAIGLAATARAGLGQPVAEFIATFVLVLLIVGLVRTDRIAMIPAAVGAWVMAIVVATVSTGFANPAVTVARMLTDTYAGIQPSSAVPFLVAQVMAAFAAGACALILFPSRSRELVHQGKEP